MGDTPFKILRRPAQPEPENKEKVEPPPVQTKTLEEKEAHYASVRRRIMGEDYNPNVNISEEDSGEKSMEIRQLEKTSPPVVSPMVAPANKSPSNKPVAVPLMSIPTPALVYNKSFEGNKEILDLMMLSRQNQMPLLGAPQPNLVGGGSSNFISNPPVRGRHSDTALPHGFASAPKMYGVPSPDLYSNFSPIPNPNRPQLSSRQSLPAMTQPLDPSAFQMTQQYQNWGMMYPQVPQSGMPPLVPTTPAHQPQQPFMQGGYDSSGLNLPPRYQHYPPSSGQPPPYYHLSVPTTTTR
ncbi:unnamed protein product [Hymenolepis diminuta]|uniref:SUZ domain-containing protein n=2 Tax=Hymenolepis diminuta TaxID=6216 RepID=A0A0R3SUV4_HYMDI|nr:unnamed protein product [Hymenolepis diminuta]VUZ49748.1 unnamed protein product [Hymenolepis diminuta]